jgi:hypothetical protein
MTERSDVVQSSPVSCDDEVMTPAYGLPVTVGRLRCEAMRRILWSADGARAT